MNTYTEQQRKWQKHWRQTIKGKASTMWTSIGKRIKNEPSYENVKCLMTREDFLMWVVPQLTKWVEAGNPLVGSDGASLDRINSSGNYELTNLQIISQRNNNSKRGINLGLVNERFCCRCKLKLPTDKFYKDRTRKGGLSYSCKECRNNDRFKSVVR